MEFALGGPDRCRTWRGKGRLWQWYASGFHQPILDVRREVVKRSRRLQFAEEGMVRLGQLILTHAFFAWCGRLRLVLVPHGEKDVCWRLLLPIREQLVDIGQWEVFNIPKGVAQCRRDTPVNPTPVYWVTGAASFSPSFFASVSKPQISVAASSTTL